MRKVSLVVTFAGLLGVQAALATPITHLLGDHPDAALWDDISADGPNGPYGLRYDNIDPPDGIGPTFSVGSNLGGFGGALTLTWDPLNLGAGAQMVGTIYRNDDGAGGACVTACLWDVVYNITGLTVGDGNLELGFNATGGFGTLTRQLGGEVIDLLGHANGAGIAFEFDNDGHRLSGDNSSWVGRGWLEPSSPCCDDWLIVSVSVPEPGTLALLSLGLVGIGFTRRRKKV